MKKMFLAFLIGFMMISLSGCLPMRYEWQKSGASEKDLRQDNYNCMRDSQMQVSQSEQQGFTASSASSVTTNSPLFRACMEALGWTLVEINPYRKISKEKEAQPATTNTNNNAPAAPQAQTAQKIVPTPPPAKVKKEIASKPEEKSVASKNSFIAKGKANLRENPSTKSAKVGALEKGDEVEVLTKKGEWYQIMTPDGVVAWCSSNLLYSKNK